MSPLMVAPSADTTASMRAEMQWEGATIAPCPTNAGSPACSVRVAGSQVPTVSAHAQACGDKATFAAVPSTVHDEARGRPLEPRVRFQFPGTGRVDVGVGRGRERKPSSTDTGSACRHLPGATARGPLTNRRSNDRLGRDPGSSGGPQTSDAALTIARLADTSTTRSPWQSILSPASPLLATSWSNVPRLVSAYYTQHPDVDDPRSAWRSARRAPGLVAARRVQRAAHPRHLAGHRRAPHGGRRSRGRCISAWTRTRSPSRRSSRRSRCSPRTAST
jgi:hypothetical protein